MTKYPVIVRGRKSLLYLTHGILSHNKTVLTVQEEDSYKIEIGDIITLLTFDRRSLDADFKVMSFYKGKTSQYIVAEI